MNRYIVFINVDVNNSVMEEGLFQDCPYFKGAKTQKTHLLSRYNAIVLIKQKIFYTFC